MFDQYAYKEQNCKTFQKLLSLFFPKSSLQLLNIKFCRNNHCLIKNWHVFSWTGEMKISCKTKLTYSPKLSETSNCLWRTVREFIFEKLFQRRGPILCHRAMVRLKNIFWAEIVFSLFNCFFENRNRLFSGSWNGWHRKNRSNIFPNFLNLMAHG